MTVMTDEDRERAYEETFSAWEDLQVSIGDTRASLDALKALLTRQEARSLRLQEKLEELRKPGLTTLQTAYAVADEDDGEP